MPDAVDISRQGLNVVEQLLRQQGATGHTHKLSDLSKREKKGVQFAAASYIEPSKRKAKMHGYRYSTEYSSPKYAVYKRGDKFHIGIRGTTVDPKTMLDKGSDVMEDVDILKGKFGSESAQMKDAQALMDKIIQENPKSMGKLQISGHSLAGRQVLELLHKHPKYYKDSVAIAPGFSPIGSVDSQEHMKTLVQGHANKNFIIGRKNDVVWQSAEKYMVNTDGNANQNVKILPAVDTSLKGAADNHFLAAFSSRPQAHVRMEQILTKHGFSKSDVARHVQKIKRMTDDEKAHARVDKTEKRLDELDKGGSLRPTVRKSFRPPRSHPYGNRLYLRPKKKRST